MKQLRSTEARDWQEGRRLRAWELHQQGWKQHHEIATALGVTQGAVSQWLRRGKEDGGTEGGTEALRRRKAPGAIPRLTLKQRARLPELLARGAEAHGFRGEVWTWCARVAEVIEVIRREFGVRYHPTTRPT